MYCSKECVLNTHSPFLGMIRLWKDPQPDITSFSVLCLVLDEVAAFLRDQEFYWNVKGVASGQELVNELTTINPPGPPIRLNNDGGNNISVGCFVRGAGIYKRCFNS